MADDVDGLPEVGHPIQRTVKDLSKESNRLDNGAKLMTGPSDYKSPAALMRQMGFNPSDNMNPLQFLVAVLNDDTAKIYKNEKRRKKVEEQGGIAMSHRMSAATVSARYFHMAMPIVSINKNEAGNFGDQLAQSIAKGDLRVTQKTVILDVVERISPDVPVPAASYPPEFAPAIEGSFTTDFTEAEGDASYNPDTDD